MPLDSTTIIEKRVGETILAGMDFGSWLASGETIDAINSITAPGEAGTITVTSSSVSGTRVIFFVAGGEAGVRYLLKVNITTSLNQIFIGEGPLKVVA